jgi:hypothetical protein
MCRSKEGRHHQEGADDEKSEENVKKRLAKSKFWTPASYGEETWTVRTELRKGKYTKQIPLIKIYYTARVSLSPKSSKFVRREDKNRLRGGWNVDFKENGEGSMDAEEDGRKSTW